MFKFKINAVLYSKQNLAMADEVKLACREFGISLLYAIEVVELLKYLNELVVNIVFIDCETVKIENNIINVIKSFNKQSQTYVVCLTQNTNCERINDLESVDYIITNKNLLEKLKEISAKINSSGLLRNVALFDYCEINKYLTDYLINIGLEPKFTGFTYIKQAVEFALKNNAMLGALNRVIYPTIASKNKTEPQNVERNIRNAIKCACRGDLIKADNISILIKDETISNRAFLSYLLDNIINTFSYS